MRSSGRAWTSHAPTKKRSRPWFLPAISGLAVVVALAVWQPWKKPVAVAPAVTPAAAPPALSLSNGLTEARQLTLKARALIDDDFMAATDSYRLADELCKKATTLAADGAWQHGA